MDSKCLNNHVVFVLAVLLLGLEIWGGVVKVPVLINTWHIVAIYFIGMMVSLYLGCFNHLASSLSQLFQIIKRSDRLFKLFFVMK